MTIDEAEARLAGGQELVIQRREAFFAPVGRHYLRHEIGVGLAREYFRVLRERYYTRNGGSRRVLTGERRPDAAEADDEQPVEEAAPEPDPEPAPEPEPTPEPEPEGVAERDAGGRVVLDQPYYSIAELCLVAGRVSPGSFKTTICKNALEHGGTYAFRFGREKSLGSGITCLVVYPGCGLCRYLREKYDVACRLGGRQARAGRPAEISA